MNIMNDLSQLFLRQGIRTPANVMFLVQGHNCKEDREVKAVATGWLIQGKG
jgi:hypothetical protein